MGTGDGDGAGVGAGVGAGGTGVGFGLGVAAAGGPDVGAGDNEADAVFPPAHPARTNKAQIIPDKTNTLKPSRKLRFIVILQKENWRLWAQLLWLHPAHTYLLWGKILTA